MLRTVPALNRAPTRSLPSPLMHLGVCIVSDVCVGLGAVKRV